MATNKDALIATLGALSKQLGRELSAEGTAAELQLRIREAEDELATQADGENTRGNPGEPDKDTGVTADRSSTSPQPPDAVAALGGVRVQVLTTLHINALHETRDQPVKLAYTGDIVRVPAESVDALRAARLISVL